MKKILSIALVLAIVISCVSMITFGPTGSAKSANLLPDEISDFTNGVTTHENLTYLNGGHIYSKAISAGALTVNYYGYASNYTTPMWLLGKYIKAYATENSADSYTVEVSMDVKGSINSANLSVRRFGEASDNKVNNLSSGTFNADTFTTVSGTFTLTKAEVNASDDTWYALCLANISRPATLGGVVFDNVTLKITAVGAATPVSTQAPTPTATTAPEKPIGLLPIEISVFGANGVTTHEHMGNSVDKNRFNAPSIVDGAFAITKLNAGWVETAAAPTWILAPYIKAYATENPAESYDIVVSMDVKGALGTTSLIFRQSNVGNQWGLKYFESKEFTADKFTTVSGAVNLTSTQISEASANGYALCLENIPRGVTTYFDNIVLKVTAVNPVTPTPVVTQTPVATQTPIASPTATPVATPTPTPSIQKPHEGLLPEEISVFDGMGVTTHEHMGNSVDKNRFNAPTIVDGAIRFSKLNAGWVETAAAPTWILAPYIKAFATEYPADSYDIKVSMDVKGAVGTTSLIFRNSNVGNKWGLKYFESKEFTADKFTTVSGNVSMTYDQISEASENGYALCLENIPLGATVYFDNIVLTIVPKTVEPIGLLPNEISIFNSGNKAHPHLVYKETDGHIYSKNVLDSEELSVAYKAPADKNNTPMWLLGSYIKNFATLNDAKAYKVEIAMDVKGGITSADMIIRRFGSEDDNKVKIIKESVGLNGETYTTISGVFYLSKEDALKATETQYALAVDKIALKDANSGSWGTLNSVQFDNIVLKVYTAEKVIEIPLDEKEVYNGDAEDGLKNWSVFSSLGGKIELSTDTKSGTGHSVKYSSPYNAYGSIGFNLGPAIIEDELMGYKGRGNGTYVLSFDAKATSKATVTPILNSQAHADLRYAAANTNIELTTKWKSYQVRVEITDKVLDDIKKAYKAGQTNAYDIILRIDAAKSLYKSNTNGAYWIDNVSIKYVEGSGAAQDRYNWLMRNADGVKFSLNKDLWDGWIVTSAGMLSKSDVKDGYAEKSITIKNTSNEDIYIRMFLQTTLKLSNGSTTWAGPEGANSELIQIPAGESKVISAKVPVKNNKVEVEYGGKTYKCDLSTFFIRFNFEKGIFKGNSFIIECKNSDVPRFLSFMAIDKQNWTAVAFASQTKTGDEVLWIPACLILITIPAFTVLAVKKRKEQ